MTLSFSKKFPPKLAMYCSEVIMIITLNLSKQEVLATYFNFPSFSARPILVLGYSFFNTWVFRFRLQPNNQQVFDFSFYTTDTFTSYLPELAEPLLSVKHVETKYRNTSVIMIITHMQLSTHQLAIYLHNQQVISISYELSAYKQFS